MRKITLTALTVALFTACSTTPSLQPNQAITFPSDSTQLLMVTTENWSTKDATLQRYHKERGHWQKVGDAIAVVIGRNGLGWGIGLHQTPKDAQYVKKEGDGKAPAGLFSLNNAFGYNKTSFQINFPYATYKTTDHCVDDSTSRWYNKIVDSTKIKKDYNSFEHMKLTNNLYKYGIVVNHNPHQTPQAGSCIFMHIKSPTGKGTAGCTAMSEDKIVKVLKWLKGEEKPLLLQLPKEEVVKVVLN